MNITRRTIADCWDLIIPFIRRTPVLDIEIPGLDNPVSLKLEYLQHAGSFKTRGAFANMLGTKLPKAGVAAASGGNHGAAVAYAASQLGIKAHIFVPEIASPAKISKIRKLGADITIAGKTYADVVGSCDDYCLQTGAVPIHAYDSPDTLTGQATMAAEFETQMLDGVDTVLMAVGGGGLIGGAAAWYRGSVKLIGVETEKCATMQKALTAGKPVTITASGIAADSLGAARIGSLSFPLARQFVDHVCLVDDDDILVAQKWLWENVRILSEPGGAAAFAAILSGKYTPQPLERLGIIICGANSSAVTL